MDNYTPGSKSYLPCIFVGISNYNSTPKELGWNAKYVEGLIEFEILANNPSDRKRLSDLCYNLENDSFVVYDINSSPKALNINGELINNVDYRKLSLTYPLCLGTFSENGTVSKSQAYYPLHYGKVRIGFEIPIHPKN
jgi:hypothetical protein